MLASLQRAMTRSNSPSNTRTYAIEGLSHDASGALRSIMQVLSGRTQCPWQLVQLASADVLVLGPNFDAAKEASLIGSARHIVRVTLSDESHFGEITRLEYPFRVFQVLSTFEEVAAKLGVRKVQSAQVPTRNRSWALFDSLRDLASYTSHGQWQQTRYDDGRVLFVRDDLCEFAADPSVHKDLLAGQLPQLPLTPSADPPAELQRGRGSLLLWHVGLNAGRGNLSRTLDPTAGYRLLAWPDFGVTAPRKTHLRLSALLASGPYRRDEVVEALADSGDVVTVNRFINACAASGLLHTERRESELPAAPRSKPSSSSFVGSLILSIRSKLGFGGSDV